MSQSITVSHKLMNSIKNNLNNITNDNELTNKIYDMLVETLRFDENKKIYSKENYEKYAKVYYEKNKDKINKRKAELYLLKKQAKNQEQNS